MDQQQATDFIRRALDQGMNVDEIASDLATHLKAPTAIVRQFVLKVEAQHPRPQPPPPQPFTEPEVPEWLDSLRTQTAAPQASQPASSTPASSTPASPMPASGFRLPPWLQDNPATGITAPATPQYTEPPQITDAAQAEEFVRVQALVKGRPQDQVAAELARLSQEPFDLAERFVNVALNRLKKPAPSPEPEGLPAPRPKGDPKLADPALYKFALGELTKGRKRSDVVMEVCERAGVGWPEAQRFVGQILTEKHGQIKTPRTILTVVMGVGSILLGLFLAITYSFLALAFIAPFIGLDYRLPLNSGINDYASPSPYSLILFGTGLAFIAGGVIGIINALRQHMG